MDALGVLYCGIVLCTVLYCTVLYCNITACNSLKPNLRETTATDFCYTCGSKAVDVEGGDDEV